MRSVARFADLTMHPGIVAYGNATVLTNGRPTAALLDPCRCGLHGMASIVGGNGSVLVGGKPIARILDPVSCTRPGPPPVYTPPQSKVDTEPGPGGPKYIQRSHEGKIHLEAASDNGSQKVTVDIESEPREYIAEKADVGGQVRAESNDVKVVVTKTSESEYFSEVDEIEVKGQGFEGDADAWAGRRDGRTGAGAQLKGGASGGSVKKTKDQKLKLFGLGFGARRSKSFDFGEGSGANATADWDEKKKRFSIRGAGPVPVKLPGTPVGIDVGFELYVEVEAAETDKLPNFILTGSPDVFTG